MVSGGARAALFIVDAFVALTALGGGVALVAGMEADRFPPEMLRGTPFGSYVIPGLILAIVVGGSAAATLLLSPGAGAPASIVAGDRGHLLCHRAGDGGARGSGGVLRRANEA